MGCCNMASKALAYVYVSALLLISVGAEDAPATAPDRHVAHNQPIVIHTQLENYEQPTFSEYKECVSNRNHCIAVCASHGESDKCISECPVCPELRDHDLVVQGVNDTKYLRGDTLAPINTTNVIRLTNEIRNIIENKIEARNENNVALQQNATGTDQVANTGGKYGLGYDEHGSCCYVVRTSRHCETNDSNRGGGCKTKNQRVCGERCTARFMIAKRVVKCENDLDSSCREHIEYVPRHKAHKQSRCRYIGNRWPYVSCGHSGRRNGQEHCTRCLQLPYSYVLSRGLPPQCANCFQSFPGSYVPLWGPPFAVLVPVISTGNDFFWDQKQRPGNDFNLINDHHDDNDGWVLESKKCRLPDGTLSEDCAQHTPIVGSGNGDSDDGVDNTIDPSLHDFYDHANQDGYEHDYNDWPIMDDNFNEAELRRRRRAFKRSSYSRRHKLN